MMAGIPPMSDRLAVWRHSQRHDVATANWASINLMYDWLTTPDERQAELCEAKLCPRWLLAPKTAHTKGCFARHVHQA